MNHTLSQLLAATLFWGVSAVPTVANEKPNFVWILSEDNSKHYLRLFDEAGAATPAIEKMAARGLIFERAFSCSPVCSVARTTLMTGLYAPRVGTQFHRKIKTANLPAGWRMFPSYLRDNGYYTTNRSKKDYNCVERDVWDESSRRATWRNRPKNSPFFHMVSLGTSHESSLHFTPEQMEASAPRTHPQSVRVAPYHPDTPLFRYTYARYHDRIQEIDRQVQQILDQLDVDGLLENTFVFYFGDHGGVLPRSKGYLFESGLHVPLVVRVPSRWKHLVKMDLGSRVRGFVSFVDFGPTLLHLAGLRVPPHLDGRPFLGSAVSEAELNRRDEALGYADRFDEKYDLCRSLRKGRFKYIRNYQPFYPDALQNNYRYRMLAYQQWRTLFHQGKLTAEQRLFFQPKQSEALYDLESDPHEVDNLAGAPEYSKVLVELRRRLGERLKRLHDLSVFPESFLVEEAMDDPLRFGAEQSERIASLLDTSSLSLLQFSEAEPHISESLASDDPWQRYWGLIVCSSFGNRAQRFVPQARSLRGDANLLVRVRAAEFLAIIGADDPRPVLYKVLKESESSVVSLITLNTIVYLRDRESGVDFELSRDDIKSVSNGVERRLEYLAR